MPAPVVKVELALDLGNRDPDSFYLDDAVKGVLDNTSYTLGGDRFFDITDRVLDISTSRGRSQALDRIDAGTGNISLDNSDRLFDPLYAAGPYFGQLIPKRKIKASCNGFPVIFGYIDDLDISYLPPNQSVVGIQFSDALSTLTENQLPEVFPDVELSGARVTRILDLPTVAWPTNERQIDDGNTFFSDVDIAEGTSALTYLQTAATSEAGDLFIAKNGDLVFKERNSIPGIFYTPGEIVRTNLVPFSTISANSSRFITVAGTGGSETTSWVLDSSFPSGVALRRTITTSGSTQSNVGNAANLASSAVVTAGQTYTLSAFVKSQFATDVRIASFFRTSANTLITPAPSSSNQSISAGVLTRLDFTVVAPANAVALGIRVFYTTDSATSGQFIDFTSWLIEESSSLGEYFDGNTLDDSGPGFVYDWTGDVQASTSVSRILVEQESPTFFDVVFSDEAVIDDLTVIPFSSLGVVYGSENLYNRVLLTNNDPISPNEATAEDLNSQQIYGPRSYTANGLLTDSESDLQYLAEFILARFKEPQYRFDSVSLILDTISEEKQNRILDIEIGDIVQVRFTPSGIPPAIEQYCKVIGISHDWANSEKRMTFALERLDFSVFRLNDLLFGILDEDRLSF
jgi:hypothetical protein